MINIETLENLKNWYFLNPDYATNINEMAKVICYNERLTSDNIDDIIKNEKP